MGRKITVGVKYVWHKYDSGSTHNIPGKTKCK